eukprot:TRINITY_DN10159_c0_g1_i1.p1 TRINITY_DN10159_c0_g1~~TRINITY_DN10159_c0_g1_i1.p1  ORF type:complete len:549 (+),score=171.32 TRINITY_DN10159_c0_g1_i1:133-1779(+)
MSYISSNISTLSSEDGLKIEVETLRAQLRATQRELETVKGKKTAGSGSSYFTPSFLKQLASPDIHTVLLIGCGGGFDFIQSMLLYPELKKQGKNVIIVSNSFTDVNAFHKNSPMVWANAETQVRKVSASSTHTSTRYIPEVHLCSFLDRSYPEATPHVVYGCNATKWSVHGLTRFLQYMCAEHKVGAVVVLDGGSDSLLRGDEGSLGHPIEDAVTVGAVASLGNIKGHRKVHVKGIDASLSDEQVIEFVRQSGDLIDTKLADPRQGKRGARKMRYGTFSFATHEGAASLVARSGTQFGRFLIACEWDRGEAPLRLLVCVNVGADRVSGVTDASSMRAIAEITGRGGYKGCVGLEPSTHVQTFFNSLLEHMDSFPPGPGYYKLTPESRVKNRSCREALHHAEGMCTLAMSVEGHYGPVGQKGDFVWPVMSLMWAFDPQVVANRSLILEWIKDAPLATLTSAFQKGRMQLRDMGGMLTVEHSRDGLIKAQGSEGVMGVPELMMSVPSPVEEYPVMPMLPMPVFTGPAVACVKPMVRDANSARAAQLGTEP